MNKILAAAVLGALTIGVAGCAGDGRYHSGASVAYYDGYYDDAYGPLYDGYWGGDGAFYYSSGPGVEFRRDEGRHFRHENAQGFHSVHGMRPTASNAHPIEQHRG